MSQGADQVKLMRMKGQLNVKTAEEYVSQLEEPRRSEIGALHALVRKLAPKLEPVIYLGMPGYGPYRSTSASGRPIESCKIAFASNANYLSLYVGAAAIEACQEGLGQAKCGKGCVKLKRLSDLDPEVLKKLLRAAAAKKTAGDSD